MRIVGGRFKGRDLTPKGTITERAAQGVDVYPKHGPGDRKQGKGGRGGKGGGRGGDDRDDRPPRDDQREK